MADFSHVDREHLALARKALSLGANTALDKAIAETMILQTKQQMTFMSQPLGPDAQYYVAGMLDGYNHLMQMLIGLKGVFNG